jgi:hypothetical protein
MNLSFGSTQTIQGGTGNPGGSFITSTTSMVSGNVAMAQYYQKYGSFFSNADIQGITWDRSGFWDVQKTTIEELIVQPGLTAQVQKLIREQAEPPRIDPSDVRTASGEFFMWSRPTPFIRIRPPGFNPKWTRYGNEFTDPKTGTRWRYHPEDDSHWEHWDVSRPGKPKERIPIDPDKGVFKFD